MSSTIDRSGGSFPEKTDSRCTNRSAETPSAARSTSRSKPGAADCVSTSDNASSIGLRMHDELRIPRWVGVTSAVGRMRQEKPIAVIDSLFLRRRRPCGTVVVTIAVDSRRNPREPTLSNTSRRLQTSHTRFTVGFSLLLYAVCNTINIDSLSRWFRRGDGLDYSALCAYLVAGLCLFIAFFTLLAHRRTIKPVAILLTILSAAATYFIAKYGVAIDSSMVQNTVH